MNSESFDHVTLDDLIWLLSYFQKGELAANSMFTEYMEKYPTANQREAVRAVYREVRYALALRTLS